MSFATLLRRDVPASLVVFLVAVPLSLGIALASGAPIVAGLIAAVVGGVIAGLFGGSPLQVSGPAAGLTVVVAETINRFGWAATCAIVVAAGAVQILLGLSRIARAALAISPAIVHGMLAGIGLTIVFAQLHVVLGGSPQSNSLDNLLALPGQVIGSHDAAAFIGVLTIGVLLLWPRLPEAVRKVPGPLAAVALATVLALVTGLSLDRIQLPENLLAVSFAPQLPPGGWFDIALAVVTIALIASVESLLSAIAVDKLHNGPRANLNRELVGQGMANMASGAIGGLPVTGVIVRSSTNVAAGARTRASAVLHAVWVLLFSVLLAGLLESIPLAALAGLLVHVGAKLVNTAHIREVRRHGDLPIYVVTVLGVVFVDLLSGVLIGIGVAVVMMLLRTRTGIRVERDGEDRRVIIDGPLTFLAIPRLARVLADIPVRSKVTLELVVDYLDHAAFDNLSTWQQAHERAGGVVVVDEIGHPWFAKGKSGSPTVNRLSATPGLPRWLAPWSDWQAKTGAPVVPDQRSAPPSTTAMRLGTTEFQRRTAPLVHSTLSKLADGQQPHTLFITCADARIVPNLITTSGPGDLFAVRNIGNLVPLAAGATDTGRVGYTEDIGPPVDTSVGASIEYAVGVLRVPEVVVCGHSSCGAMKLMVDPGAGDLPAVRSWLRHAEPSLDRYRTNAALPLGEEPPAAEGDRLALHNILQQLAHLRRYPVVAEAEARGELHLTGMYFDVGAAQVYLFDPATGAFAPAGASSALPSGAHPAG